jgi:hypothetical protein
MALALWARRTGDRELERLALDTFVELHAQGRTSSGTALRLTRGSEQAHAAGNWCHGVAGYLWCMVQAFGDDERLRRQIDWAVDVLDRTPVGATPTYCHGLAGRLELWRMLAGIPRFTPLAVAQASRTARALRHLHHKRDGSVAWCSDDPAITTPDLWIGFLGPATAMALHAAGARPALLSPAWLGWCAGAKK